MQKGNINGALNLITSNMVGVLLLKEEMIRTFEDKHPEPASVIEGSILIDLMLKIYPTAYADIDSSLML